MIWTGRRGRVELALKRELTISVVSAWKMQTSEVAGHNMQQLVPFAIPI